jgi:hypothetical protein
MLCLFNEIKGTPTPIMVESTMVAALQKNALGATTLMTTGGQVYVDADLATAAQILGWPVPVTNTAVPLVSGTGVVGTVLHCTTGEWTGKPTTYAYQWLSDVTVHLAADASKPAPPPGDYTVVASDVGKNISCVVTATNALGSTPAPLSNAVMGVAAPPPPPAPPPPAAKPAA